MVSNRVLSKVLDIVDKLKKEGHDWFFGEPMGFTKRPAIALMVRYCHPEAGGIGSCGAISIFDIEYNSMEKALDDWEELKDIFNK